MTESLTTDIWESHGRPALAELFGSALYSFLVFLSSSPSSLQIFALFDGLALTISMFSVIRISEAHLNPVISLVWVFCGKMPLISFLSYSICQFFGSFLGTVLGCWLISSDRYEDTFVGNRLAADAFNPQMPRFKGLCLEAVLGSIVALSHLISSEMDSAKMSPLFVGLTRSTIASCGFPLLGLFGSPSLSLSSSTMRAILVSSLSPLAFFYLVLLGALAASLLASAIFLWLRPARSAQSMELLKK